MIKKNREQVVLTKPLLLEGDPEGEYKAPNIVQRLLSLFKNVRPGSDLTTFQCPASFNFPKSYLQCFGETVYCVSQDILSRCNNGRTPLERFTRVVAWSISTTRPAIFGIAPFNPVLGETHHVSRGTLNVLLEQVSHHPPVSALHATDDEEKIEMTWCHHPAPKFYGTKVEAEVQGKRELKLLNHEETYVTNSPNLSIRLIPPGVDWVGNVKVRCEESGFEADLCYSTTSFLGRGQPHLVRGKIYQSSRTILEVNGQWNGIVSAKDVESGKETVIYDAKEVIEGLKAPIVKDLQRIWPSESAVVWSEVSMGILNNDWDSASEAKREIEKIQREVAKERAHKGETWAPKFFSVTYDKEDGWTCSPKLKSIPPAPIVVPIGQYQLNFDSNFIVLVIKAYRLEL